MRSTCKKALFLFLIIATAIAGAAQVSGLMARELPPVKGAVAIFYQPSLSIEVNAISIQSLYEMTGVFNSLGRFLPVEDSRMKGLLQEGDISEAGGYSTIAEKLQCHIYILITVYRQGPYYFAKLAIEPVRDSLKHLKRTITLRSAIAANIPYKLAREIAFFHKGLELNAEVIEGNGDVLLVSAGEWHGLAAGRYSSSHGVIEVLKASRYRSYIRTQNQVRANEEVSIKIVPDYKKEVAAYERKIDEITIFNYSVSIESIKGDNPEKRFVKAFCLVNIGASIVLPGYGSYLSTSYLGVKQKKVSIFNVVLTPVLVFTQLTLVEMMTGFKSNFFPWNRDSDKSIAEQNLHIFCWSTLLTTYSASFLDQLAHQYGLAKKLPPFFGNRNISSAFFSLLVPGGGLFYKGHRVAGWSFYFAEMALAGYGAYSTGLNDHYKYAFSALALVKLIDIVCAYFVEPSYVNFRIERERQLSRVSVTFDSFPDQSGNNITAVRVIKRF